MISVLLLGFDASARRTIEPGDLVRTLTSLVPATVEGVVRDLCLAGPVAGRGLAQIADHAGCGYVEDASFAGALRRGARQLRCSYVLVTRSGVSIGRPVMEELSSLLPALGADENGFWLLRTERRDLVGRLFPSMAPSAALLAPRRWLEGTDAGNFEDLTRRARPRRTLLSAAWPAP